mgnify:CR=1 FL=1
MNLSEFDYNLPKELIAQQPAEPRDSSRLLVLKKDSGALLHKNFFDLPNILRPGDVLVFNDSKVFPARLFGGKRDTGGKMEVSLLKETGREKDESIWECLIGGRGASIGLVLDFEEGLTGRIIGKAGASTWLFAFDKGQGEFMETVEKIGEMPLPPYIKARGNDRDRYQTVYAKETGSVAAPTAGLHFTNELTNRLKQKGVQLEFVTLHVGLGTFAPVKTENIKEHKMHAEWAEISKETVNSILKAKKEGRRVIAVGTTSVRALEAVIGDSNFGMRNAESGIKSKSQDSKSAFCDFINIFIYPGYEFKIVDGMITNFHLPKSTLLMLISALAGKDNVDRAYAEAIKKKYRFYSYGDAMLIL